MSLYVSPCFSSLLGFISSLPQLAWDKRLCCCCCCRRLDSSLLSAFPTLILTMSHPSFDLIYNLRSSTPMHTTHKITRIWNKSTSVNAAYLPLYSIRDMLVVFVRIQVLCNMEIFILLNDNWLRPELVHYSIR